MTTYKLTYFDFDGGRAEPVRIAFHIAGIEFEDDRISFPEFGQLRSSLRFNAVPVLQMDGQIITQSIAMGRYIGKLAGLYPADALQALYCDEVMGAIEDMNHYVVQTFGLEGAALKDARETLVNGRLTPFLAGLDELLQRGGGEFYAAGQLTVADLFSMVQVGALGSGNLDHIPTDLVARVAPALVQHMNRIGAHPGVSGYYASRA